MPGPTRAAIEGLLTRLAPRLWALARQHCRRDVELELPEFVQELRIRVWQALERDSDVEHWPAYLRRAAVSVVIDAQRRRLRAREVPLEALPESAGPDATPERRAQSTQSLERVLAAIRALPERRRRPTALLLQGFTTEEIATMLDISEASARNLAYRGLDALRAELGHVGTDHADD